MKSVATLAGAALAVLMSTGVAHAATLFTSTFEDVPGGPIAGQYTTVTTADGWAGGANGIELQNNVAGAPAPDGGSVFVELDTNQNSSMSRAIADAGTYTLSFEYSPRPGQPSSTTGIEAFIDGALIDPPGDVMQTGGSTTNWTTFTGTFTAKAGSSLMFAAEGNSDSYGGYIDNVSVSSVSAAPEPAAWVLMLGGVALLGGALRMSAARRREDTVTGMIAA